MALTTILVLVNCNNDSNFNLYKISLHYTKRHSLPLGSTNNLMIAY
jgi:hypothetical protein